MKRVKRATARASIERTLHKFAGLKGIPNMKATPKKALITHMKNKDGEEKTDRQDIANIFAIFLRGAL